MSSCCKTLIEVTRIAHLEVTCLGLELHYALKLARRDIERLARHFEDCSCQIEPIEEVVV